MRFTCAIVRPPGPNFAQGLTSSGLGPPVYELALEQHHRYCLALEQCGLSLVRLEPDPRYPDSVFVEDTAVLTQRGGILARPGVPSRAGETTSMREVLQRFYPTLAAIEPPGTLEGGDVCDADGHFFIGISQRTNEEGARQLSVWLSQCGYSSTCVDIRGINGLVHLKSGLAWVGHRRLAVVEVLARHEAFRGYELIQVPAGEVYAANALYVNEQVFVAAGHPKFLECLGRRSCPVATLQMSEFQKMDGGLSCLSLRF